MALLRILSPDTRRSFNATDPRWKFKTVLHIITLVASVVAISLFASSIPLWDANFFHNRGPNRGDWTDGMSIGPLAITFLTTLANLAYTFIKRKPFPSKIATATTSLILVTLAVSLIFAGQGALFRFWKPPAARSQSGTVKCNLTNMFTRDCEPVLYQIGELQIGGIVFGTLTWFLVFLTFLVSLYENRISQVGEASKGEVKGLRRLTLMTRGEGRYTDIEKGAAWAGVRNNHYQGSSNGSRSSQRPREHHHERRHGHRQHGTSRHYRSGVKGGSGDTVPFVFMREPEEVYPHPRARYM